MADLTQTAFGTPMFSQRPDTGYLSGKILESRRDFPRDTRVALAIGACRMSLGDHTASRRHCSLPGSVYILYRSQLRFSVQCQEMTLAMLPLRTKDA
jgi:hypothetical protein